MTAPPPILPDDTGFDILLIDDQLLTAHLLQKMLENEQGEMWRLDYLPDPLLAEAKVQEHLYDVILLDIVMPGMDGFELLQLLRNLPQTCSVPIVMLTSNDDASQKARAFSLGANDYLVKLPDEVEILARLRYYGTAHRVHLQQKRAEIVLQRQSTHLQAVLDNALDAIISIDRTGRIVDINPATVHLFGYSHAEIVGQFLANYILSEPFWQTYAQALRESTNVEDLTRQLGKKWEVDGVRENGQQIDLKMAMVPTTCTGAAGCADELRLTAFLQDITDQKQLLRSLRETLSVAEAANRVKSDFLATMSHEIRTPMNAVIGLTDLALQAELPPKIHDYLTKIQSSSQNLLRIINDILDFSKLDAGQLKLESVHFTLTDLFEYLKNLFGKQATEKGINLRMDVAPDCLDTLLGDPFRLEQVLINLIGNAIKFTKRGHVECQVQREEPPVGVKIGADDPSTRWFKFFVQDTGIGLTATQQEGLFNPFVQADSSTTRQYGGTGLGLSICKHIVDAMDGQMAVESTLGEGSLFYFSIPLVQTQADAEPIFPIPGDGPDISAWVMDLADMDNSVIQNYRTQKKQVDHVALTTRLGGAHLLLVEDMPINQQVAKELLEKIGIRVDVASDGAAAVRLAALHLYDAILMDIQMPGMDGYEATRIIRSDPRWADRPIIAMTAHVSFDDQAHCLAAGMSDHVGKPIDKLQLYDTLARWINTKNRVAEGDEQSGGLAMVGGKARHMPEQLPGIDLVDGLYRMGDNHCLYRSLLEEFAQEFSQAPEQIRRLLAGRRQEDLPTASRQLHALQGMASNLAAQELSHVAYTLEQAIKAERRREWPDLLDRFAQAMQQVVDSIHLLECEAEEEEDVATDAPPDLAVIIPLLTHLAELVADGNAEALPRMRELKAHIRGAGVESALRRLDDSLNQFDFDEAEIQLDAIVQALNISLEAGR